MSDDGNEPKSLRWFIFQIGDDAAADLFEVKTRTIQSWRLSQRQPSLAQAFLIFDRCYRHPLGPLSLHDIYEQVHPDDPPQSAD